MAVCAACNAEVAPGSRWCSVCHTNVQDPEAGKLASPAKRLIAYILDLIIPVIAISMMVGMSEGSDFGAIFGTILFLAYIVGAIYLFLRGTTPGKRVMGMYVVKENGKRAGLLTMLLRETVGKWLSGLVMSLGWIWILIDKENQGWHDKLASTYVVG
ncbi:RDD family protein [bacterium]|nr:RDD family protein [bacterium]